MGKEKNFKTKSMMKQKLHFQRVFASLLLLTISMLSWAYDFEVNDIYYSRCWFDDATMQVTSGTNSYSGDIVIPSSVMYGDKTYNVTAIGERAFSGCSGLTSVIIPESVTVIGDDAFSGCSGLTSINIPNSVKGILGGAFYGCSGLTSVSIGRDVRSIGWYAFKDCSRLTSVICWRSEPPTMGEDVFYNVPQSSATLYVYDFLASYYKAAEQWREFGTIVGTDPTGIEELKAQDTPSAKVGKNAPIYDLNGRRVPKKSANGYYIQGGKKYLAQ